MATEKNLLSRIVHKHDIKANWDKAVNFVPKQGELIVYDKDNYTNFERIKIGDGETNVINLPFYLASDIDNLIDRIEIIEERQSNQLDATIEGNSLVFTRPYLNNN